MKTISKILLLLLTASIVLSCSSQRLGKQKEQKVLIQTTEGDITLKLYNETPLHRDNFIRVVKAKTYNGVLFHRVIKEFMIQGGDPDSKTAALDAMLGEGDVGYTVPAEFRTPAIYHKYGVLAAAREGYESNPEKASSGCQFYIVVGKKFTNEQLDKLQESKIARYGHANDSTYKFSFACASRLQNHRRDTASRRQLYRLWRSTERYGRGGKNIKNRNKQQRSPRKRYQNNENEAGTVKNKTLSKF